MTWSGDSSATALTWFHEWHEGSSWATYCCLLVREEGSDPVIHGSPLSSSWDPETEKTALLLMFWVPLAANKRFSIRPSSGGGSGRLTISRRAVSSISESPISGPLAPVLTVKFDGGLDGQGILPATGSTTLPGEWLLRQHGSEGSCRGRPRQWAGWGAAAGVEAAGFLRCMMRLIASVCFCAAENCWAKLSPASPKRPVCDGSIQELYLLLLLHVSKT